MMAVPKPIVPMDHVNEDRMTAERDGEEGKEGGREGGRQAGREGRRQRQRDSEILAKTA